MALALSQTERHVPTVQRRSAPCPRATRARDVRSQRTQSGGYGAKMLIEIPTKIVGRLFSYDRMKAALRGRFLSTSLVDTLGHFPPYYFLPGHLLRVPYVEAGDLEQKRYLPHDSLS
jgi:hypothetical protein